MNAPIPVVLFAYARPDHLARVLASLRENGVPRIEAFADGPRGTADTGRVAEVRARLRAIDWCEVRLVEREGNFGLGRNVLAGVGDVAARHEAFLVWEDDLVAAPGAYAWMTAALRRYADDPRVWSVGAWTQARLTPPDLDDRPYFDARAECWGWGAWARSWPGMAEETAAQKMAAVAEPAACGADLPEMAAVEQARNLWAVRWLYHHLQHGGLCLRPPRPLAEHIGFDDFATNAAGATEWANPPLQPAPRIPDAWPDAIEHPACRALWRAAIPPANRSPLRRLARRVRQTWRRLSA
jgi:hypothetical protein